MRLRDRGDGTCNLIYTYAIPGDGGFLANGKVNCQAPRDLLA